MLLQLLGSARVVVYFRNGDQKAKTNQTSPSGLAVSDHRSGNIRQHVHSREVVLT